MPHRSLFRRSGGCIAVRSLGGFSLIEMLLVVVVVAMLALLVIPAIGQMRYRALSSTCQSNIRQLTNYMVLGALDNGGELVDNAPAGNDEISRINLLREWSGGRGIISRQDETVLVCPVNSSEGVRGLVNHASGSDWECYYKAGRIVRTRWVLNGVSGKLHERTPTRLDDENVGRIPVVWDQRADQGSDMNRHKSAPGRPEERSGTFGYLDGSVRFIRSPESVIR